MSAEGENRIKFDKTKHGELVDPAYEFVGFGCSETVCTWQVPPGELWEAYKIYTQHAKSRHTQPTQMLHLYRLKSSKLKNR